MYSNQTIQCSISIEKTALQLNLELWVGGGPFDLIDSQSPFNLDLDLDFWIWTFGLTIFSAFFVKKRTNKFRKKENHSNNHIHQLLYISVSN